MFIIVRINIGFLTKSIKNIERKIMKTMEEKRDELASEYAPIDPSNGHESCLEQAGFTAGWDACAKQYEEINILLKELQLAVAATDQLI